MKEALAIQDCLHHCRDQPTASRCQASLRHLFRSRASEAVLGADEEYVARQSYSCGLTPELSRPGAGRRTRASVAQARGRRHDAGSA